MQSSGGPTILVGEDELEVRGYFQMALASMGYSVELAQDGDEVVSYLRSNRSAVCAVVLDLIMPNRDGLDTLSEIREIDPGVPVIIVSGIASSVDVVTAMRHGATDFLLKPVSYEDLGKAIRQAMERHPGPSAPPPGPAAPGTGVFLGENSRMREIQALMGQTGWSDAPVLIQGETGTGKEVIARELHARSPRSGKAFLKINCAALPSELVESELFGYERGAFTGAFQKKIGMFENADGGTILLDEIGDMNVRLQAKLLQVLQDSSFQRIGGKDMIKVDVRIMAATHRDLEKCILDGTFREDLYYRLNVINICLPPLRERKDDVLVLTELFLQKHSAPGVPAPSLTTALEAALISYSWPGNVRELENCVRKLLIFRDPDALSLELQGKMGRKTPAPVLLARTAQANPPVAEAAPVLEEVVKAKQKAETDAIFAALAATHWNRKRAAALLRIDYKALLYKMKKLAIEDGGPKNGGTASANGHGTNGRFYQ